MCENGTNPGVPLRSKTITVTWSHAYKTMPWYLLGLYFKISDKHTYNFYLGAPHHPKNGDSDPFH